VGTTAAGQPVVTTPQGTLLLQADGALAPGTVIRLAPDPAALARVLLPAALDPHHGHDWPALREVMSLLAASDPSLARAVAQAVIPQPNRRLTTNLLFFLTAIRGGDAGGWLGEAARAGLDRTPGGREVFQRLVEDFQNLSRAEPMADGWKSLPIPFGMMPDLERIQLSLRGAGEEENARPAGEPAPRRFLIDLELSRLGPMQLDGLVRPQRLDLMVRTMKLLPADLARELGDMFRGSLEGLGYTGTLSFQTGAHAWVRLKPARRSSAGA
jgi:hypothetical protein